MARTLSVEYYAAKPSNEYLDALSDYELAGFQDAANGEKPNVKGVFDLKRTFYYIGYRKGKAALAA